MKSDDTEAAWVAVRSAEPGELSRDELVAALGDVRRVRGWLVPAVLGGAGEVLDQGRSRRTASRGQRRALRAMHRGCAHPACDVGFDSCRIHHVRWWWRDHGPSDIDNLLPLCERHHHLVHEGGWTLTMTPDRVATWLRPDGTLHHRGPTIDRRPPPASTRAA